MYKVIKLFTDLQDNNRKYQAGDIFPRDGLVVSQERLDELSSDKNRRHTPLIEKIEEMPQTVESEAAESDTELEVDPETNGKAKAEKKPRKNSKKRGTNAGANS